MQSLNDERTKNVDGFDDSRFFDHRQKLEVACVMVRILPIELTKISVRV